jgi:branched-chain amino acid transport system permease protein
MGAIAIGVMLLAPAGIWGFVVQRHGVQLFPIQRRLVLDSRSTGAVERGSSG